MDTGTGTMGNLRGKFITLEGIDGAGKSTHLGWLVSRLRAAGTSVVSTREPGGTPLGERLRELLLGQPMSVDTEILLMFAARAEHLARLIRPALDSGQWVVSDRFTDASFAYQSAGRGVPAERIRVLEQWLHPDLQPDLTLLFDVPPEVAGARMAGTGNALDRFERERVEFFGSVREGYLARARAEPGRIRVVDAQASPAIVQKQLEEILINLMNH